MISKYPKLQITTICHIYIYTYLYIYIHVYIYIITNSVNVGNLHSI